MVAPLFILPHIVHLKGTDNLQSGFKCKQIMVAPISILSHIAPYCSPLSLKFPQLLHWLGVFKYLYKYHFTGWGYCQAQAPNPKPWGLELTLKSCRPPTHHPITFKHEGRAHNKTQRVQVSRPPMSSSD